MDACGKNPKGKGNGIEWWTEYRGEIEKEMGRWLQRLQAFKNGQRVRQKTQMSRCVSGSWVWFWICWVWEALETWWMIVSSGHDFSVWGSEESRLGLDLQTNGSSPRGTETTCIGTSVVVQWLGPCLPLQGTQTRCLVQEDPTFRGAMKPTYCDYWTCTGPRAMAAEAPVPHSLCSATGRCEGKPTHSN